MVHTEYGEWDVMGADWNLREAAEKIKYAGFDPAGWSSALSFLADTLGCTGAVIFGTDGHVAHAPSSVSLEEVMAEYRRGGWYDRDCRRDGVGVMLRAGIMTDKDVNDASLMTDYYRDFLPRHRCDWFSGVGFKTGADLWCLAIQRSAASGPFQLDEIEQLKTLWRPLGDSATLTRVCADRHALATIDALEYVHHAAVICDHKGEVVGFNEAASKLLGHAYDTKRKCLRFTHRSSAENYGKLLKLAIADDPSAATIPLSATLIDNSGQKMVVRAISLNDKHEFVFYRARTLLLFARELPDFSSRLVEFRLTPAEFAVADALRRGGSVASIAKKQGVQENTIRKQLKSIFDKTNVRTQSQLVALIYSSG